MNADKATQLTIRGLDRMGTVDLWATRLRCPQIHRRFHVARSMTFSMLAANLRSCALRRCTKVGLVGRASRQARMWALAVVKVQIPTERSACIGDAVVGAQIGE